MPTEDLNDLEAIATLLTVADLRVPPERHADLAARFAHLAAQANALSARMREHQDLQPVVQFVQPATDEKEVG